MIQTELKESEDAKIAIIDFDFETVETALKFCYGIEEKHFWSVESAMDVLCFADKYQISDLKTCMENFLSFQLSPMNVCRIANVSVYTNSFKLCHLCFEYLLECNQNKIFVADLQFLHEDFSAELMEAIFSQSPSLEKMESTPENDQEDVQQFQNPVPQIRTPFLKKVFSITTFMVFACSLIAAFFSPKFKSYYQSINQIWHVILHLSIQ
uniref:BTB domain-containing protein n=1 Tax=Panagrolaimus davidi TaxID=227884 RepID=A0A914PJ27_9BILA